jgi:hypothetical protein
MGTAKSKCLNGEPFGAQYWSGNCCLDFNEPACEVVGGVWMGWNFNAFYCENAVKYYESGDSMKHGDRRYGLREEELDGLVERACKGGEEGCDSDVRVDWK